MTHWTSQLVKVVGVPQGFEFKPPWEELRSDKWQWAWLVMVAYEDPRYDLLDGAFTWAFSVKKPVSRNDKGEFVDTDHQAVGGTGRPLVHSPVQAVYVPLGVDYRQVLVERPRARRWQIVGSAGELMGGAGEIGAVREITKLAELTNKPSDLLDSVLVLDSQHRRLVQEMAAVLNMPEAEILRMAVEDLYKKVKEEDIKAEKVE